MAPRTATKSTTESAEETKRPYTPPPAGLLEKLAKVEIVEDDTHAFGRGSRETIPEDHPLVAAYLATYKHQRSAKFETDEPDACINILRRIAADRGKGIRTSVTDLDGNKITLPERQPGERSPRYSDFTKGASVYVVFIGREKKQYTRKVSDSAGTSGELPSQAE
jgi:hypothetical protein